MTSVDAFNRPDLNLKYDIQKVEVKIDDDSSRGDDDRFGDDDDDRDDHLKRKDDFGEQIELAVREGFEPSVPF